MIKRIYVTLALAMSVFGPAVALADPAGDLAVVRNTVINILDAMVQKGLLTREQADQLVQQAQKKTEAEQVAQQKQQAGEPGDVRVTYVPETVRAQISQDVSAAVKEDVTKSVVATAKAEGWGVPGALPEWVRNATWSGDVRIREMAIGYGADNSTQYIDFQKVNKAGGIGKVADPFLNTTEDENRFAARLRFGGEFQLASYVSTGFRIATGNSDSPVTRDVALADSNRGATILLDQAWVRLGGTLTDEHNRMDLWFGKIPNPWLSTELVWDTDVTFNGLAVQYAYRPAGAGAGRGPFGTLGVFPLKSIQLSSNDKWMFGGQLGFEYANAGGFTGSVAVAYYDYRNISGERNAPDSTLLDYTAPDWVQKGNTLFDIRNAPIDPTTNLYALAADYHLLDFIGNLTYVIRPDMQIGLSADLVRNIGYTESRILARTGVWVPARRNGYRAELQVGAPQATRLWAWRVFGGYTYVERDAVLDAFNDSDFHLGGTDAQGYFIGGDMGLARNTWLRLRYLSADEIDGPPLAIDVLFLDLNTRF